MKGILGIRYLHHLALLVRGIYLLCQEDISPDELVEAEDILSQFYQQMDKLYGELKTFLYMIRLINLDNSCNHTSYSNL